MIRRKEEMRLAASAKAYGEVSFVNFMEPEDAERKGRLFARVIIGPGGGIGYHSHQGEFEAFYLLSGTGIVNDNGTETELHAGDMHLCKAGDSHGIRNESNEPLEMIALILNSEVQQ